MAFRQTQLLFLVIACLGTTAHALRHRRLVGVDIPLWDPWGGAQPSGQEQQPQQPSAPFSFLSLFQPQQQQQQQAGQNSVQQPMPVDTDPRAMPGAAPGSGDQGFYGQSSSTRHTFAPTPPPTARTSPAPTQPPASYGTTPRPTYAPTAPPTIRTDPPRRDYLGQVVSDRPPPPSMPVNPARQPNTNDYENVAPSAPVGPPARDGTDQSSSADETIIVMQRPPHTGN